MTETTRIFALLNEIGIIAQLSRTMMETRLPDGVTMPQFLVLNHMVRLGDGWTPLRLARVFQVPKTSMTNTLAGLEARGLVEMCPNPEDGRSKLVMLTEAGRRFRAAAIEGVAPDLAAIAAHLPSDRIEALMPDLERLRRFLDEARSVGVLQPDAD
jgi:DNA-binding MarR family transcriptional regulator